MSNSAANNLLEVCVDSAQGLAAAVAGGADRIELCAALELGGLTPSPGLMRLAAASAVPVYAMVRPRAGHFIYDEAEIALMLAEIDAAGDAGLAGVVLGASLSDGRLDARALARLHRRADGMGTTLHRAIDLCPDLFEATHIAADLGFDRILTSGGARRAPDGIAGLLRCCEAADGRIAIMPGSGVGVDNVALLRAQLAVSQFHASCSEDVGAGDPRAAAFGFELPGRRRTSEAKVRALKAAVVSLD
jgi:copper homeostasis protein